MLHRFLLPAGQDRGPASRVRRDADRLQVDRTDRRPALRLRGSARLLRRSRCRPRQGRAVGGRTDRRVGGDAASGGQGISDALDDIARGYGLHATDQLPVRVADLGLIDTVMERLRTMPPSTLGGRAVEQVDLRSVSRPSPDRGRALLAGRQCLVSSSAERHRAQDQVLPGSGDRGGRWRCRRRSGPRHRTPGAIKADLGAAAGLWSPTAMGRVVAARLVATAAGRHAAPAPPSVPARVEEEPSARRALADPLERASGCRSIAEADTSPSRVSRVRGPGGCQGEQVLRAPEAAPGDRPGVAVREQVEIALGRLLPPSHGSEDAVQRLAQVPRCRQRSRPAATTREHLPSAPRWPPCRASPASRWTASAGR